MELASRVGSSGRVVGVDPDNGRIAVAKAELLQKSTGHVPVTFLEGSTQEALPFDAVYSNFVFQFFERDMRPKIYMKC